MHQPPSPAALKDVLNMVILVTTLLFAVTVTIPFGFSHEELIAYTNLWREGGIYGGLALESRDNGYEFTEKDYTLPVIELVGELVGESVLAVNFLFAALVISIIMYVSLLVGLVPRCRRQDQRTNASRMVVDRTLWLRPRPGPARVWHLDLPINSLVGL
jgi:hypothetical protein